MTYREYAKIVKLVFSEEIERMGEWIYSIENEYDCSDDKCWIKECPGQSIPGLEELEKIVGGLDKILLTSEDDDEIEQTVEQVRANW